MSYPISTVRYINMYTMKIKRSAHLPQNSQYMQYFLPRQPVVASDKPNFRRVIYQLICCLIISASHSPCNFLLFLLNDSFPFKMLGISFRERDTERMDASPILSPLSQMDCLLNKTIILLPAMLLQFYP